MIALAAGTAAQGESMAEVDQQTQTAGIEKPAEAARDRAAPAPVLVRGVILVALLVLVDLWGSHHFGIGIRDPGPLAAGIAVVTAALGWLDKVVGGSAKETVSQALQRAIRAALATPILVGGWMLALVVFLTYSSVILIPSSSEAAFHATVTPLDNPRGADEKALGEAQAFLRFVVTTGPFGRPFRVKVPGYVTEVVDVPPLTGLTLRPYREFRPSPSVLLRPPPAALGHLQDGRIDVWIMQGEKKIPIESVQKKGTSFLVGRFQPVPGDLPERWRLELMAQGFQGQALASILLAWSNPTPITPDLELEPGMRLEAEVRTQGDVVVARTEHKLGTEGLTDLRMLSLEE